MHGTMYLAMYSLSPSFRYPTTTPFDSGIFSSGSFSPVHGNLPWPPRTTKGVSNTCPTLRHPRDVYCIQQATAMVSRLTSACKHTFPLSSMAVARVAKEHPTQTIVVHSTHAAVTCAQRLIYARARNIVSSFTLQHHNSHAYERQGQSRHERARLLLA